MELSNSTPGASLILPQSPGQRRWTCKSWRGPMGAAGHRTGLFSREQNHNDTRVPIIFVYIYICYVIASYTYICYTCLVYYVLDWIPCSVLVYDTLEDRKHLKTCCKQLGWMWADKQYSRIRLASTCAAAEEAHLKAGSWIPVTQNHYGLVKENVIKTAVPQAFWAKPGWLLRCWRRFLQNEVSFPRVPSIYPW